MRITRAMKLLAVAALSIVVAQAAAQSWPAKPIRVISPFSAGSTVDLHARLIATPLSDLLGQPVIVENKAGAGGAIGLDAVAKAAPDGYTIGIGTTGPMSINPYLIGSKVPYDPNKDFVAVGQYGIGPNVIVVNANVPARTLAELIALAKSKPGTISYASSSGIGSTAHLAGELLGSVAGIEIVHIPYKGNAEAVTALLAGQVQMAISGLPPMIAHIQSGRLRALAVTGPSRMAQLPDVPTVTEAGVKEVDVSAWYGVVAPAGTPPDIVTKLNDAFAKAIVRPEVRDRFLATGTEPHLTSPKQFADLIRSDGARWADVIRRANVKAE
ncbi:MAG TPA: tripartite tricarboxylate transporter substrate binding protein [Casimicrobiaceae bacterium]|nr:tripartite tricarboxylate transporter substrate binding protein [Casimicrobiaceae bacterium]